MLNYVTYEKCYYCPFVLLKLIIFYNLYDKILAYYKTIIGES